MALDKAGLKNSLQTIFTSLPVTVHDAAVAWAQAYATYAAGAQSCSVPGTPASLAPNQAVLQTALEAAFFGGTVAATTASAIASALTAFWLSPPVVFSGITPGAVSAVAGTALLQTDLISMWANNVATSASAPNAAQSHADVFDIFTKTVLVTHAPPSTCTAGLL